MMPVSAFIRLLMLIANNTSRVVFKVILGLERERIVIDKRSVSGHGIIQKILRNGKGLRKTYFKKYSEQLTTKDIFSKSRQNSSREKFIKEFWT